MTYQPPYSISKNSFEELVLGAYNPVRVAAKNVLSIRAHKLDLAIARISPEMGCDLENLVEKDDDLYAE